MRPRLWLAAVATFSLFGIRMPAEAQPRDPWAVVSEEVIGLMTDARGPDWVFVGTMDTGNTALIHPPSIQREGTTDRVRFWAIQNQVEPHQGPAGRAYSWLLLMEVACQRRTVTVMQAHAFAQRGAAGEMRDARYATGGRTLHAAPGSIGEAYRNVVCPLAGVR